MKLLLVALTVCVLAMALTALDTVSTTCGSGWVRSRAATDHHWGQMAAHPPATAGGTDPAQQEVLSISLNSAK